MAVRNYIARDKFGWGVKNEDGDLVNTKPLPKPEAESLARELNDADEDWRQYGGHFAKG